MDTSRVLRVMDQMNIRLRKLEEVVSNLSPPVTEVKDLYVERDKVDLEDAKVPAEFISGNPLLSTLYGSESKKLTKFAIGTWPSAESANNAVVVHGGQHNIDGVPIEFIRMQAYPALINAGIPFSSVYSDPDEDVNNHNQMKLVDKAASHMVSPGIFCCLFCRGKNGGGVAKTILRGPIFGFQKSRNNHILGISEE